MASESKIPSVLALGGALGGVLVTAIAVKYYIDKNNKKSGDALKAKKKDADNLENAPEKVVTIYFGSQTGRAETFAEELSDVLRELGLKTEVIDLDEFNDITFLKKEYVLFLQSTYGEGEPTDNAVHFFHYLEDMIREDKKLKNLKYAVFGLGSKQYPDYNKAATVLDELLESNGATRFLEIGLGDDDGDITGDFNSWMELVSAPFCNSLLSKQANASKRRSTVFELVKKPMPLNLSIDPDVEQLPKDVKVLKEGSDTLSKWIFQSREVPITNIRQLMTKPTPGWASTVHVEIDISKTNFMYNAADTAEVLPQNSSELVEKWASLLEVKDQLSHYIAWSKSETAEKDTVKSPFPTPCTLRQALTEYLDLTTLPARSILVQFAKSSSPVPMRALILFHMDGVKDLHKARISFLEFWQTFFENTKISIAAFLQLCPRQKMRAYTIATSPKENNSMLGLTVGLVAEKLPAVKGLDVPALEKAREFRGLCSSWLNTFEAPPEKPGDDATQSTQTLASNKKVHFDIPDRKMRISIRPSGFSLPAKKSAPLIFIGPGTGIAPFRGFLHELAKRDVKPVKSMLFFGCRRPDEDFIYRADLEDVGKQIPDFQLICAFSRQGKQKVYVQDKIIEHGKEVVDILSNGGFLYVCGSTNMGKGVEAALEKVFAANGDNKLSLPELKKARRFYEELFG